MKNTLKTYIFLLFLVPAISMALPGSGSNSPNQIYDECSQVVQANPKSEAIGDATSVFNCNSLSEAAPFCSCVDRMANAFNIEVDEEMKEFQNTFLRYLVMMDDKSHKKILKHKEEEALINHLQNSMSSQGLNLACNIHEGVELPEDNQTGKYIDGKLQNFSPDKMQKRMLEMKRPATEVRKIRLANKLERRMKSVMSMQIKGRNVSPTANKALFLKLAASLYKENKTNSNLRHELSQIERRDYYNRVQTPDFGFEDAISSEEIHADTSQTAADSKVEFKRFLTKHRHDDAYKNSSFNVLNNPTSHTHLSDMYADVLGKLAFKLDNDKSIQTNGEIDEAKLLHAIVQWSNENFEKEMGKKLNKQCESAQVEYLLTMQQLRGSPESATSDQGSLYKTAINNYNVLFGENKSNNYNQRKKAIFTATKNLTDFENFISLRQLRTPKELARTQFQLDLHYCNSPPTAPAKALKGIKRAPVRQFLGELPQSKVEHPLFLGQKTEKNVMMSHVPVLSLDDKLSEVNAKLVTEKIKKAKNLYDVMAKNIANRDSFQKRSMILLNQVKALASEMEKEHNSATPNVDRVKRLNDRVVKLSEELAESETHAQEWIAKAAEAEDEYNLFHRMSAAGDLGATYLRVHSDFVYAIDTFDGAPEQYIDGKLNENYQEELAEYARSRKAELSSLEQRIYNYMGGDTTSIISTDADENRRRANDKAEEVHRSSVASNYSSIQELQRNARSPLYNGPRRVRGNEFNKMKRIEPPKNALLGQVNNTPSQLMPMDKANPFDEKTEKAIVKTNEVENTTNVVKQESSDQKKVTSNSSSYEIKESDSFNGTLPETANLPETAAKAGAPQDTNGFQNFRDELNSFSNGNLRQNAKFPSAKIKQFQNQADAIESREDELDQSFANYNDKKARFANNGSSNNDLESNPKYSKILEELASLRTQNGELESELKGMQKSRTDEEGSLAQVQKEQSDILAQTGATPLVGTGSGQSKVINNEGGNTVINRAPASNNNSTLTRGTAQQNNAPIRTEDTNTQSKGAESKSFAQGGTTVLPQANDNNSGGFKRGASTTTQVAAQRKEIVGKISQTQGLPILTTSKDPLAGSQGFTSFMQLVGSENEVSLEAFQEMRTDPSKLTGRNINRDKPLIVITPEGHLVMMPIFDKNEVTGFEYVKEVKPEHIERKIASEKKAIAAQKRRLIYDADLDSLLDDQSLTQ